MKMDKIKEGQEEEKRKKRKNNNYYSRKIRLKMEKRRKLAKTQQRKRPEKFSEVSIF